MVTRYTIFAALCLAILSLAQLATILTTISPATASPSALWLFFGSGFVFLTMAGGLVWYLIKRQLIYRRTAVSLFVCLRQTALFSAVLTLTAFFSSLQILSLWDIVPLAIAVVLIELFFQAEKVHPVSIRHDG